MNLTSLGWNETYQEQAAPYYKDGLIPARVASEQKQLYRVLTEQGELHAEITGKMRFQADGRNDYPAVGDWVMISPRIDEGKAIIHTILPRKTKFSRKIAGQLVDEQIVAANIDTVFIVNALNNDFNIGRIERYLILTWESGANPVILLSKADLCTDIEHKIAQIENIAIGVPILVISSLQNEGLDQLQPFLEEGHTSALLGSSGVGKSSIVNRLIGETVMEVRAAREGDDRGRHTTTHRELIALKQGGLIIDTPGMRELGLWDSEAGIQTAFDDVEEFTKQCRFDDCTHKNEPGCAVKAAIHSGELDARRYDSYVKLQRELKYILRKENHHARIAEKKKSKKVTKSVREKYTIE
nr:ribosome small subunit-dependent GTPase A [Paenibacillus albiflavus]